MQAVEGEKEFMGQHVDLRAQGSLSDQMDSLYSSVTDSDRRLNYPRIPPFILSWSVNLGAEFSKCAPARQSALRGACTQRVNSKISKRVR